MDLYANICPRELTFRYTVLQIYSELSVANKDHLVTLLFIECLKRNCISLAGVKAGPKGLRLRPGQANGLYSNAKWGATNVNIEIPRT